MVTAKTQYSLTNAKGYFEEHLCVGDYYDEGQRVAGEWIGLGAERLGLSGKVRAEEFLRLCDTQHPPTEVLLTHRPRPTPREGAAFPPNRPPSSAATSRSDTPTSATSSAAPLR